MSPIKLIHTVRLWEARRLLESEGLAVSEAAYAVGFGSPSYFTKLFKGAFGYLPSGRGGAGVVH
jgi:AraC-like DNA-binding protein